MMVGGDVGVRTVRHTVWGSSLLQCTGLLGKEDCGPWHSIAGDKQCFRRFRLSHSDQRDERRQACFSVEKTKSTKILTDRFFNLKTHTKTLPVDEILSSREGPGPRKTGSRKHFQELPLKSC